MESMFLECMMDQLSIFSDLTEERYVYQETTIYDLLDKLASFFKRLTNDLLAFGKRVKSDIQAFIDKQSIRIKLKKMKNELNVQNDNGVRYVKMVDVDEYLDTYKSYEVKLIKQLDFFAKGNFKTREKMICFADKLENDLDAMEKDLERIVKNKVKISIKDAIRYVDENLNGKSNAEAIYVDACHKLNDIRIKVEHSLRDQALRTDTSFSNEYMGIFKRTTTKITKKIAKAYSKIVLCIFAYF